jgi:hypothetical protein
MLETLKPHGTSTCPSITAPGEPHLTRMVIFGAMLGVLDPVLTLAAADMQFQGVMRRINPAAARLAPKDNGGRCLCTCHTTWHQAPVYA